MEFYKMCFTFFHHI